MKFTFNEVLSIYDTLNTIKSNMFKINYWISRNKKVFEETFIFIVKERQNIYEEFLYKDEHGNYFNVDTNGSIVFYLKEKNDEYAMAFSNRISDLFETICELDPYLINVTDLVDSDLSVNLKQVETLDKLFIDQKE